MMTLEKSHQVVYERIKHFLLTTGDLSDVNEVVSDYDGITYFLAGLSADCLTFSAIAPQLASVGNAGGFQSISEYFQGHPSSIDGQTCPIVINRAELPPADSPAREQAAMAIARKFSLFRVVFLSGPFIRAFNSLKSGATSGSIEVNLRPRENVWMINGDGRVSFVYQIREQPGSENYIAAVRGSGILSFPGDSAPGHKAGKYYH